MNPEDVVRVFSHWQVIMDHPRARMDLARAKIIRARLQDGYTLEDLCLAIDGNAASAWHQGENDRHTRYDQLSLILRDGEHVERFMEAGERAHKMLAQREERRAEEVKTATPPTPEQVEKVRDLLRSVKLRRVA